MDARALGRQFVADLLIGLRIVWPAVSGLLLVIVAPEAAAHASAGHPDRRMRCASDRALRGGCREGPDAGARVARPEAGLTTPTFSK